VTDLPKEELEARLAAISRGPWSVGFIKARQKLAPIGEISLTSTGGRPIALEELELSASNKRKSAELSKILRVHYEEGNITDEDEIETREALDDALTIPQLYELAVQTGYLPEDSVRKPARSILTDLLWSDPARRFVEAYDYVAVPMLAARVGISGFVPTNPPEPTPNASLRFAGFLAHVRAFYSDEQISTWIAFLDDYIAEDDEQDLVWEFLRERRKSPPKRIQELLTGCQRFVTSLASAFHVLSEDEFGRYGLVHAYWLQKFFGYKRNGRGEFVKDTRVWGENDSWAQTFSTSPLLVPPDIDPAIEAVGRRQFNNQIVLLERTFEAVKHLASATRERIQSVHLGESSSTTRPSLLTEREHEIIQLIAQGYRNKEIGEKLFMSEQTVKKRLDQIRRKLGISHPTKLAQYAARYRRAETP
jgi:DNA-binding CsgD family transcriptional regulator